MRYLLLVFAVVVSNTANCQQDSTGQERTNRPNVRAWIVPTGIVASTTIDGEMREWALHTHSRKLDHLAHTVNPLGTAHVLVPAMAVFYAGSLVAHRASAESAAVKIAVAYAAADIVESVLKSIIGRQRPFVTGNSHRFHAFSGNGDWHSFPSAHVAHIAAIAEAVSMQTTSRSLAGLFDGLVGLVGWDRVYEDQHWTSDVTATIALSALVSRVAVNWFESRYGRP
ncbi:MAG TPA: phosphatase PAP2 family protein [Gemmatimonadaceae bacterium]|nr:phosphatase PAP2 family protein [Gemmatimonadaceae bacterium]